MFRRCGGQVNVHPALQYCFFFSAYLRLVRIFFDRTTFDDIERDKKIKIEALLSLIGGTMGLLQLLARPVIMDITIIERVYLHKHLGVIL